MVHLSRLAEDVILFSSEEFGFLEIHDSVATGSSLMPQKKNPDPLELVRGKSGKAVGLLTGWLTTMKGLPLGYNKDLQEDKAVVFEAEDLMIACARTTATVIRTLTLRPDVTRAAASGLLLATEVADYLVARGLPFRSAHEVTGRIVRDLYARGADFSALALEDWRAYHERFEEGVFRVVTPEAAVAAKKTPQSTNPASVAAMLAETRAWIATRTQHRDIATGSVRTYGLTHVALAVRDPERSLAFYQAVLGVVPVYRDTAFVQAQTPGAARCPGVRESGAPRRPWRRCRSTSASASAVPATSTARSPPCAAPAAASRARASSFPGSRTSSSRIRTDTRSRSGTSCRRLSIPVLGSRHEGLKLVKPSPPSCPSCRETAPLRVRNRATRPWRLPLGPVRLYNLNTHF